MDNVDWSGSNVYVSCLVVFFNDRLTRYTGTRNGKSNARRVLRISPIRRALSLRDATSLSGLSQCQRVMCRAHWVWQSIVLGCLPQRGVWELLFLGFRLKDRVGWICEVSFFLNAYVAFVKIP